MRAAFPGYFPGIPTVLPSCYSLGSGIDPRSSSGTGEKTNGIILTSPQLDRDGQGWMGRDGKGWKGLDKASKDSGNSSSRTYLADPAVIEKICLP